MPFQAHGSAPGEALRALGGAGVYVPALLCPRYSSDGPALGVETIGSGIGRVAESELARTLQPSMVTRRKRHGLDPTCGKWFASWPRSFCRFC